ncbi:hypothetical protein [Streptomyces pratensis]|jgi:hypothetical protein|nr:hypothetical protein [Streptomyces pratensis]
MTTDEITTGHDRPRPGEERAVAGLKELHHGSAAEVHAIAALD